MKTLLVTGATGSIGKAVVKLAALHGYAVAVGCHKNFEAAHAIAAELRRFGTFADVVAADLARHAEVSMMFSKMDIRFESLSAVIHCAGHAMPRTSFLDIHPHQLSWQIKANLMAPIYVTAQAAFRMARSRGGAGGAIVLMSSEAGRAGGRRIAPYAAAKGGVNAFVTGAARELAEEGIRLNAVSPSLVESDALTREANANEMVKQVPMGRAASPDEIAEAALWLVSDAASYVTGAILPVTGGR